MRGPGGKEAWTGGAFTVERQRKDDDIMYRTSVKTLQNKFHFF